MSQIAKLGHLSLQSPDVSRLVEHYVGVLDFTEVERAADGTSYLTSDPGHHSLTISPSGSATGMTHLAFDVRPGALDDVAAALRGAGRPVEERTDPEPSVERMVVSSDLEDNALHFYTASAGGGDARPATARPQKLGHVCYFVEDIQATVGFYEEVLGFRWSDWMADFFVFLRCGPEHHTINLLKSPQNRRLHHIGYEVRDWAHVQLACDRLAFNDVPLAWGPGRHGPGHNVFTYHYDPDGNVVELFCELDVMLDEKAGTFEPRPWHRDVPQRPKVWTPGPMVPNKWGPMPPPDFLQ